ncbi:MAG: SAV_915 family protein [Mycobacterium sp.]
MAQSYGQAEQTLSNVFVPMFPLGARDDARLLVELWGEENQHRHAVGYLTLDALTEQLGPYQPWALMSTEQLRRMCLENDLGAVIIDPLPGTVMPRWTREKIDDLVEVNDGLAAGGA